MMWRGLVVAFLLLATAACGKKGPLLPPYVRQPAAAEITAARRVGNDVYVTFTVPKADLDGATPASLATIDVYAVTSPTPPPPGAIPRGATLVITVPVARDAEPGDRSGKVVPDPKTGVLQGTTVTIVDTLTAEELEHQQPPPVGEKAARPEDVASLQSNQRYYVTVPRSPRKRIGLLSAIKEVPLAFVPDKVPAVDVAMSEYDIVVRWEPSGGILGWLLDRALAPEVALAAPAPPASTPPGTAASTPPTTGQTLYNIYREVAPDPRVLSKAGQDPSPWTLTPATPINPEPIAELLFVDKDVPFDERQRCYRVRAVRGTGAQQVESASSDPRCTIPVDLVPPVAPTGLSATVVEGEVQLRWEPNGEEDLRGYVVLRRESGSDTLLELTREGPTTETRWIDRQITPGRMYTYVVQAVDTRIPLPNVSEPAQSETITAR